VQFPLVMEVSTAVPAKTVPEFIAYAKANPGKVNMASGGVGSPSHVVGELFQQTTGIKMEHVPYHGGAPALAAMMANQVQVMFSPLPESIASIKAGKVRALAVTSVKRAAELPDTPAVAETVPGFEAVSWNGIGAPKKTPADIVAKLNKEINTALADPAIKTRLTQLGGTPSPLSTPAFEQFIVSETKKWGDVVHKAGITVQ